MEISMKYLTFFATLVILTGSFSANADEICGKPIRVQAESPGSEILAVTLERGYIVSPIYSGGMSSFGVLGSLTTAIASGLNICFSTQTSNGLYFITSVSK